MSPQSFKITLSDALLSQVSQFAKGLTLTDEGKAEGFYNEETGDLDVSAVLAYLTGPGTYLVSRPLALNKARAIMLAAKGTITPAAFAEVYGDAEARNSHREPKAPRAAKVLPPAASPTFDPLAAPPAPVKAPEAPPVVKVLNDKNDKGLAVKAPKAPKAPKALPPHAKGCTCRTCKPAPAAPLALV